MTEHTPERGTPRRVVVLLDASRASLEALEAAAEIAAHRRAELLAIFVEEEALLRCAGYPWAREVGLSGATRPLETDIEEQRMRTRAEEIRRALAYTGQRRGVHYRLEVCRGGVVRETLSLVDRDDLLILGKVGYARARGLRIGSTARAIVFGTPGPVMVFERPVRPRTGHGVAVVVEPGEPGVETLTRAAALLGESETLARIIPDHTAPSPPGDNPTRAWAARHCPDAQWLTPAGSPTALARHLSHAPVDKLIISRRSALLAEHNTRSLIETVQLPVLVVP
ncbi:universal stress protein [Halorhodospira halophila]|uniref:UspA domain protein n=1 Tax=Halorhodospira halophila (strain DSM 244 / SL1) TaxID=349124 RepID=A1WXS0_HALHL|nr:universal stress protein [Halorhodospira halophila]ABM62482.1 UspA domain protein [Halorhodospira halophila SL1]